MGKTVFEKVISGEFEGSFMHRDDLCVAFMDLNPLNTGHVLVVPRDPVSRLSQLDPKTAAHLFAIAQRVLKAIEKSEIRCQGANLFMSDGEIAGQEVPHVHLHIVPRFEGDRMRMSFGKTIREESRAELDRVARLISDALP